MFKELFTLLAPSPVILTPTLSDDMLNELRRQGKIDDSDCRQYRRFRDGVCAEFGEACDNVVKEVIKKVFP